LFGHKPFPPINAHKEANEQPNYDNDDDLPIASEQINEIIGTP
jgi:hypothetical protein